MIFNPFSKIFMHMENSGWVLTREAEAVKKILKQINIPLTNIPVRQVCYLPDKYYAINQSQFHLLGNRQVFDYFHGIPSVSPQFSELFKSLKLKKNNFAKIRVSNNLVKNFFLNEGFSEKISMIPIGIDLSFFSNIEKKESTKLRIAYDIPLSSVVVGSFQKDGVGWGEGNEPKLIKGPDIFLKTIELLKEDITELYVLLTGPSRGYMKKGLAKLNIPYKHIYLKDYREISKFYSMLDLYLISSREEGGPKSVLESMASGIPIVSTPVGQAFDMITNDVNGYSSETWDPDELKTLSLKAINKKNDFNKNSRQTAEQYDYFKQQGLWRDFFNDIMKKND